MSRVALAALLSLAACVVVPAGPRRPPPPAAAPAPARLLTQDEAIGAAFQLARARGLEVSRVQHARLDAAGRWHVDLRGSGDRAKLLLDARDGKLLKGRFRESDPDFED